MFKSYLRSALILVLLSLILHSCGSSSRTLSGNEILGEGIASWYGPGFHGKQTANGEEYNQNGMTAAHRTLPFNTVVRVVNLENGKKVDVRINDRGPFIGNRIIDLSHAAAKQIDMVQSGLAPVRVILLQSTNGIDPALQKGEIFTVQIASFKSKKDASTIASRHKKGWVQNTQVNGAPYYRVFVGKFKKKRDAERERYQLQRRGVNGFVKQVQN